MIGSESSRLRSCCPRMSSDLSGVGDVLRYSILTSYQLILHHIAIEYSSFQFILTDAFSAFGTRPSKTSTPGSLASSNTHAGRLA
jgi:hypothetical protein